MPQLNEGNINSYLVPSGSLTGSLSNSGTLTGQIAIGSGGGTTDYNDLTNKPSINSVTLSGNKTTADLNISYNDLDDKPTIPAAQVNSDWNAESGVAEILNKPTIPTKLNQLSDVNYIQPYPKDYLRYDSIQNGWTPYGRDDRVEGLSNVLTDTYEVGQVLQLTSISGEHTWRNQKLDYSNIVNTPTIPAAQVNADWNAESGVAQILNKPTIPAAQVNSDWNAVSGVAQILNKPTLATVATSGSYNDLTDKPTVSTTCSITRGSTMPSTFPVPNIVRRDNTVIVRFGILLPAGTYTSSDVLWNYSPLMVGLPALTFPVYGSGEVNLIKINTDGTITMNATKTFGTDTWIIGEAVFLTDG